MTTAAAEDLTTSPLWNPDLAPTPPERRTWSTWNIAALWIGMSVVITTYTLASGLMQQGMTWWQAMLTILLGNVIVLVPMILNAHAGTKYGIPFPVFARASFGVMGANVPALLRALVACGWFGIQTWFGGLALHQLWFSNVSTQFLADMTGALQPTQVLTSNNASPVTDAFGIPRLREERSINASGGITMRIRDTLSLSVDGYFIRLRDRIVLTSQFTNTNPFVATILAPFPGVSQAQFFANAIDTAGDLYRWIGTKSERQFIER